MKHNGEGVGRMKHKCVWCGQKAKRKYSISPDDFFCKSCWTGAPRPVPIDMTVIGEPQSVNGVAPDPAGTVLDEAQVIVYGRGEAEYGHPRDNFRRIAELWSPILGVTVTAGQAALCMGQVKVARLIATPMHRDSVVDLAGYAAVYERVKWE